MIGSWIWFIFISSEPGSYTIGLVPPMILTTIGLFIASIVLIESFFKSLKKDYYLKAADPSYIPKELPLKKNPIALAGAVIQIAIIIAIVIWNVCDPSAIVFSLPAIAIIIGLSHGISLCIRKFRGY